LTGLVFDRAGGLGPADFNAFDGAFCDAFGAALAAFRVAFPADSPALAGRVLPRCDFADFAGFAREATFRDAALAGALGDVLGDFLRVFLDIRLPFVAFGGSIMGSYESRLGRPESSRLLGKSDGLGVWLQGTRCTTRPLINCVAWAG
jgi:hypothetical protein